MKKLHGHPKFYKLVDKIVQIHSKKNSDYAEDNDPLSNLRACEAMGIPAWIGVLIRMLDKFSRLQQLTKKDPSVAESIEDNLIDISVYALLAIILYQEHGKR